MHTKPNVFISFLTPSEAEDTDFRQGLHSTYSQVLNFTHQTNRRTSKKKTLPIIHVIKCENEGPEIDDIGENKFTCKSYGKNFIKSLNYSHHLWTQFVLMGKTFTESEQ